ncbi:MAG: prepilin-type N-terminal cleavage/methylation domain-containing protein [Nitrospirae bacterium]|nr:prepilin-type N-terminal cleavage/methylation domain-containing protein [Nitrospirota bacterium]
MKPRHLFPGVFPVHILNNSKGVSLLEVLVALVLISLVLLSFSSLATVSFKGIVGSKKLTIGTILAQEKLESVMLAGYDSTLQNLEEIQESYGTIQDYPRFQRSVMRLPHSPHQGMQTVKVTVSWDQSAHSTMVSTILGE